MRASRKTKSARERMRDAAMARRWARAVATGAGLASVVLVMSFICDPFTEPVVRALESTAEPGFLSHPVIATCPPVRLSARPWVVETVAGAGEAKVLALLSSEARAPSRSVCQYPSSSRLFFMHAARTGPPPPSPSPDVRGYLLE